MKCNTIRKKLIFYLDGELPPQEMKDIKNHLSECIECAAFVKELAKTQAVLKVEKSVEANPFFYTRLKAKMESEALANSTRLRQPVWVKVLQPVVFSVLLIAGVYLGSRIGTPAPINLSVSAFSDQNVIPYLNEMDSEPIEAYLME